MLAIVSRFFINDFPVARETEFDLSWHNVALYVSIKFGVVSRATPA
jgi:hypothetical protein